MFPESRQEHCHDVVPALVMQEGPPFFLNGQPGSAPRSRNGTSAHPDDLVAAAVSGGNNNIADGRFSTVTGGELNAAAGLGAVVSGGAQNAAQGSISTVGGGQGNLALGEGATVAGGARNEASGRYSAVGGGIGNQALGNFSTIPGGSNNAAAGACSLSLGSSARALHAGSIVLNAAACDGSPVSRAGGQPAALCEESTKFNGNVRAFDHSLRLSSTPAPDCVHMTRFLLDCLNPSPQTSVPKGRKLQADQDAKADAQQGVRADLGADIEAMLSDNDMWSSARTQTVKTLSTGTKKSPSPSPPPPMPPPPPPPLSPPPPPSPSPPPPPPERFSTDAIEADSISSPAADCSSSPLSDKSIDPPPVGIPGVEVDEDGFLSSDKCDRQT